MNLKKSDVTTYNWKKNTDTKLEQTKTRPHETLDFKLTKSRDIFSLYPPLQSEEDNIQLFQLI